MLGAICWYRMGTVGKSLGECSARPFSMLMSPAPRMEWHMTHCTHCTPPRPPMVPFTRSITGTPGPLRAQRLERQDLYLRLRTAHHTTRMGRHTLIAAGSLTPLHMVRRTPCHTPLKRRGTATRTIRAMPRRRRRLRRRVRPLRPLKRCRSQARLGTVGDLNTPPRMRRMAHRLRLRHHIPPCQLAPPPSNE